MNQEYKIIKEADASPQIREIYCEIKEKFDIKFVPNFFKILANNEQCLIGLWQVTKNILFSGILPRSLKEFIFILISSDNKCRYCESLHFALCKLHGVYEIAVDVLKEKNNRLTADNLKQIQVFASKVALHPHVINPEDLKVLKSAGLSEEGILELITLIGFISYANMLADALKVPIDPEVTEIIS